MQTTVDEQPNGKVWPSALSRSQNGPVELPRLMRVAEVAAYLGVSISKIWRLLRSNPSFPRPIRMNGTTRWDRLDIDRFIEDSKVRGRRGR
nr:helix-turn-helix domain-containing protein [Marinicella sp. W31]MDC2878621.1 helix-turn-helix domain-containing protein [Marinicella sp. W31]